MLSKNLTTTFTLPRSHFGFGMTWDTAASQQYHLRLQCVVVGECGHVVDSALEPVTHECTIVETGVAETICITTEKLSDSVEVLLFVVADISGWHLDKIANGNLRVFQEDPGDWLARFDISHSSGDVSIVGAVFRSDDRWSFRPIEGFTQQGNSATSIEPLITDAVCLFMPRALWKQRPTLALQKGAVKGIATLRDSTANTCQDRPRVPQAVGMGYMILPSQIDELPQFNTATGGAAGSSCVADDASQRSDPKRVLVAGDRPTLLTSRNHRLVQPQKPLKEIDTAKPDRTCELTACTVQ